jgi:hypothetical protein
VSEQFFESAAFLAGAATAARADKEIAALRAEVSDAQAECVAARGIIERQNETIDRYRKALERIAVYAPDGCLTHAQSMAAVALAGEEEK